MQARRRRRIVSIILLVMITSLSVFLIYGTLTGLFPLARSRYVLPPNGKIAFVKPVFTATAYKPNGFYTFYSKHSSIANGTYVTTDLNMLNLSVIDDWGWSKGLASFISSSFARSSGIILGDNSFIISDADVNNGALFTSNTSRAYDVVVVGFDEYVTDAEYNQFVQFVHDGGRLIFLDACNFYVQVNYNPTVNRIQLVNGHFYSFNGTSVTTGPADHYKQQNAINFGSVYSLFKTEGYTFNGAIVNTTNPISVALKKTFGERIITTYHSHEENALANPNDQVIAYWDVSNLPPSKQDITVAAYELDVGTGSIIHSGIFGSDIIDFNRELQLFLLDAIGIRNPTAPTSLTVSVQTDQAVYSVGDNFTVFGNVSTSVKIGFPVDIQVFAPNGSLWASTQVPLNPDGSFYVNAGTVFNPLDQVGNYTVYAFYNGINSSSTFTAIPAPCTNRCDPVVT